MENDFIPEYAPVSKTTKIVSISIVSFILISFVTYFAVYYSKCNFETSEDGLWKIGVYYSGIYWVGSAFYFGDEHVDDVVFECVINNMHIRREIGSLRIEKRLTTDEKIHTMLRKVTGLFYFYDHLASNEPELEEATLYYSLADGTQCEYHFVF